MGGVCGLAYGWTNLEPVLTALAMITAGGAGCLSALGLRMVSKSKKFYAFVNGFATIVPFADGLDSEESEA